MNVELTLGIAGTIVGLLGITYTFINSRRSNQISATKVGVEAQAAEDVREDVIAERRRVELERLYGRLDKLETDFDEQGTDLTNLKAHLKDCDRREILLYHHVSDLRAHIVNNKPPPPPRMPVELVEWFETFGQTEAV